VNDAAGITVIVTCSIVALATTFALRTRLAPLAVDALLALSGAGVAAGGLLLLEDVGAASWVLAPLALALLTPVHVRALFAGEGPFRT
jgi:hypothetical protein